MQNKAPGHESVHHEAGGHSVALSNQPTDAGDFGRQTSARQHDGFALQGMQTNHPAASEETENDPRPLDG
ncbi:hypothetical protein [Planctomycetes bacterium CA13]|uniref:hypothetical protein n=1 Tax=Novipirellula herctigrandis TaxID=2527986 RepID=UPI0011B7DF41